MVYLTVADLDTESGTNTGDWGVFWSSEKIVPDYNTVTVGMKRFELRNLPSRNLFRTQ
jgi:hypothetical protein